MRSIRWIIFLLTLVLSLGALAQHPPAQGDDKNPNQGGPGHARRGGMNPEAQLKHLTEELSLSDSQQTAVKAILEDTQKQAETVRADQSLSPEDRRAKLRTLHESVVSKIRDLLNADQKKKFDEMQTKMEQRRNENQGKQ